MSLQPQKRSLFITVICIFSLRWVTQSLQIHQAAIKFLPIGFIITLLTAVISLGLTPCQTLFMLQTASTYKGEQAVSNEASFILVMPRNDILGKMYSINVILPMLTDDETVFCSQRWGSVAREAKNWACSCGMRSALYWLHPLNSPEERKKLICTKTLSCTGSMDTTGLAISHVQFGVNFSLEWFNSSAIWCAHIPSQTVLSA